MTTPETQAQEQEKPNSKEYNFRALEAKAREAERRAIEAERKAAEAERMIQESAQMKQNVSEEEDDDDHPYVDHKKLNKKLASFEKNLERKIDQKAEEKARILIDQQKRDSWLRQNPDFYDVLQHAEKFAQHDPELAETILEMPEGFERQKLVYKNIKALGLHKEKPKESSTQEKIDANRRSPYYQPSGVGNAPYAGMGDFSTSGQKNAYAKMKELQSRLRG